MNVKEDRVGSRPRSIPANRLLASVGIPLLLHSETLFNLSDGITPREALEISDDLYLLSAVLAALCTQFDHKLAAFSVELPEEIGALTVTNPLYEPKAEAPADEQTGATGEMNGDFPF